MVLLLRKFLRHGNFKNIDKVSISNTPLGGIDKAMMDDVKRDWEEFGGRGFDTRSRPGYSSLLTLIYNQIRLNYTMMKKAKNRRILIWSEFLLPSQRPETVIEVSELNT